MIFLQAIWQNVENSIIASIRAITLIFFPLAAGISFTAIFVKMLKAEIDVTSLLLHGTVFSVFGLSVAYLHVDPNVGAAAQILPETIGAVVVLFQMLGRLNPKWDVPLETHASLAGATAGVFCFLFGSIYFQASLHTDSYSSNGEPAIINPVQTNSSNNPDEEPVSDHDAVDQMQ